MENNFDLLLRYSWKESVKAYVKELIVLSPHVGWPKSCALTYRKDYRRLLTSMCVLCVRKQLYISGFQ